MYGNRMYRMKRNLCTYDMQHGAGWSEHKRVLPGSTAQRVSWMLDDCGVWPSSPGRRQGLGRLDPLKSWRPRLPKILLRSHLPSLRLAQLKTTTMAKTKEKTSTNGGKRGLLNDDPFSTKEPTSRPSKKAKLLDDSDNSDAEEGGVTLKVNDEYARRFEYNKKREEKHRCMYFDCDCRMAALI